MSLWSTRNFNEWLVTSRDRGYWVKDKDSGESDALTKLAHECFGFVKVEPPEEGEEPKVIPRKYLPYLATRVMAHDMLMHAKQVVPQDLASPSHHHIRAAAAMLGGAAAAVPNRGTLDEEMSDMTIANLRWAEAVAEELHVLAMARISQAVALVDATGF